MKSKRMMKTVTKTALANFRQNRGRNLLSGIAVALTTFLIFVVLTVGYGMIQTKNAAVNEYYPTWHMMFRHVSQENAEKLKLHEEIETLGMREDFGQIVDDDAMTVLISMDDTAVELNKMELIEGTFPKGKHDIVLSEGILKELGIQADIGDEVTIPYQLYEDGGRGDLKEDRFTICGFMETGDTSREQKTYSALTSMEYMKEQVPEEERAYRVMLRLADADKMTTDEIEDRAKEIAADFDVAEANVVENGEYLWANYVDPAFITGIAAIVLIVVLAGILTIYSIYYVSMTPKVQEYGKLKALGATKKQVRQIVFREGMLTAAIAIPAGLLVSTISSKIILSVMVGTMEEANEFTKLQAEVIRNGEVQLLYPWIYVLTIVTTLLTVYISLMKPMRTAAKVSPVEAMRYHGEGFSKKRKRKGYKDLTLFRLTKANLSRNKKRTVITTATLGATGILVMVFATILSCCNPKEMAKEDIESDYRIGLETWSDDKLNPDRDWRVMQQNNPMNEEFLEQVQSVPGVTEVKPKKFMSIELPDYQYPGEDGGWSTMLYGVDESYAKVLEKGIIDGNVTYEELQKGDKIIVDKIFLYWFPDVKTGDQIRMILYNGEAELEKTFEVAAIGEYSQSLSGADFMAAESVLDDLSDYNLIYRYDITVEQEKKEDAYQQLGTLADASGLMEFKSYEDYVSRWESSVQLISVGAYAFLLILGGICLMNLVNTMLNSIHTRRRELGMMQAIGLSEKQLIRMLQMEGLFYTVGTLAVSLGIGSLAGYGTFLYAKAKHMLNIKVYHYPIIQAVALAVIVAAVQMLLTYVISRSFRKQSLIERVRYSE